MLMRLSPYHYARLTSNIKFAVYFLTLFKLSTTFVESKGRHRPVPQKLAFSKSTTRVVHYTRQGNTSCSCPATIKHNEGYKFDDITRAGGFHRPNYTINGNKANTAASRVCIESMDVSQPQNKACKLKRVKAYKIEDVISCYLRLPVFDG